MGGFGCSDKMFGFGDNFWGISVARIFWGSEKFLWAVDFLSQICSDLFACVCKDKVKRQNLRASI